MNNFFIHSDKCGKIAIFSIETGEYHTVKNTSNQKSVSNVTRAKIVQKDSST